MLLGLVLAVAAAIMVFYITTSVQGTFTQTVQLVAAKTKLMPGTILTLTNANTGYMPIQQAFQVEKIDKSAVPPDAFVFTTQEALNTQLNNKVIVHEFLQGDFLRTDDFRVAVPGSTSGSSLTNIDPSKLGKNIVLYTMKLDNGNFGVQPGDYVDIIAVGKDAAGNTISGVLNTKGPVLVYAIDNVAKGKITLVIDEQLAIELIQVESSGISLSLVIRSPGDMAPGPDPIQLAGPTGGQ
jgi:hypothetical protein